MAGTVSLFDIINSSNPMYTDRTMLQNEELKVRVQTEQMQLQSQQAFQKAMMDIVGPGGEADAANMIANPDERNEQKLQLVANAMLKSGNADGYMKAQTALSMIGERKVMAQQRTFQAQKLQMQEVGGIASAVISGDGESYSSALPDLMEKLTPTQKASLKLTGDYATDQPKLAQLARQSATYAQQERLDQGQERIDETAKRDRLNNVIQQGRLALAQKRIEQGNTRLQNWQTWFDDHKIHEDKRDSRAQQGLDAKLSGAARPTTYKKPDNIEMGYATSTIAEDPRTKDLPPDLQLNYSQAAALAAKRAYPDDDFPTAYGKVLDDMDKQGVFKENKEGFFGKQKYVAPKTPAKAPSTPAAKADAGNYSTPDAVGAAVKSGKLSYDAGVKILREKFGIQ